MPVSTGSTKFFLSVSQRETAYNGTIELWRNIYSSSGTTDGRWLSKDLTNHAYQGGQAAPYHCPSVLGAMTVVRERSRRCPYSTALDPGVGCPL